MRSFKPIEKTVVLLFSMALCLSSCLAVPQERVYADKAVFEPAAEAIALYKKQSSVPRIEPTPEYRK